MTEALSGPVIGQLAVALAVVAVLLWPPGPKGPKGRGGPARLSVLGQRRSDGGRWVGSTGRRTTKAVAAAEDRLADLLGLVAAPLRAGVPAATSLAAGAAAVEDVPLLVPLVNDLVAAAGSGDPVSGTWLRHGRQLDSDALLFVGRAWALSERTGAPLADALKASEEVLRARLRSRERLASAAAGPRASMGVLALLPISGPVVGLACGIGPQQLYFSTTWATVSLAVGVAFAAFGWWWSRGILERAT